jgi:WD40 repeat protein/serine/threonine protein kinase
MIPSPNQIYQIFWDALQLPSEDERDAYLERACGDDHDLRRRVAKLLRAQPKAKAFLEQPIAGPDATVDEFNQEAAGTVIGPYKLLEQIGDGGFGVVYLAEQHEPIRREVAVKVLKPGMDTRQVIARFKAERQALALMDHRHIAKVLDAGQTDSGRPYFVMDLVKGLPITAFCDQKQLTPGQRLELFVDVCQAVQHAHQKMIIHRDIKPSNVLVTMQDGTAQVKVIDFGIAKALGQQLTDMTVFTGFAQMIGTPLYMSPEQAALSNVDVDTRSDIYSLGVLLYELLTGTTPFDKARLKEVGDVEMRRIICEEEPPRPSIRLSTLGQAASTVSARRKSDPRRLSQLCRGDLDWIVMMALEKDRNRRYETASAFAADVQRYLNDEPVFARPPSVWYRACKFIRRNKGPVLAASVVVLALLVGAAVATWQAVVASIAATSEAEQRLAAVAAMQAADVARDNALEEKRIAEEKKKEAELARTDTEKALLQAKKELFRFESMHYIDHIVAADQALQNHDYIAARWHLDECRLEFRHVEHAYLSKLLAQKAPRELLGHTYVVDSLALSPDGKRLFSGWGDGTIKVWNVDTGKEVLTLRGHASHVTCLVLSSDGKCLFSGSEDATVKAWDLEAGKETLTLRGHTGWVSSLALSSDGKRLFSANGDLKPGEIKVWDVEAGKELFALRGHISGVTSLALSPDGKRLFSGSWVKLDGEIKVWDVEARKETVSLRGHTDRVSRLALSSDGKRLFSASEDGTIKVWDVEAAKETLTLRAGKIAVNSLVLSADGKRLYLGSGDPRIQQWDVDAGKEILTLRGHAGAVTSLALSPDGKRLFSGSYDRTIKVWNLEGAKETLTLHGHPSSVTSLALSPDGKRLFSGSDDRTIKVWDLEAGKEILSLRGHTAEVFSLALSPDGKWLFSGSEDRTIKVWNLEAGKETLTLRGRRSYVSRLAVSPDGKRLFSGGSEEIKVWDVVAGKETLSLRGTVNVFCLAVSPDGKRLFSGNHDFKLGAEIKVWDVVAGKETLSLRGHKFAVHCLALSPDGKRLFSGSGVFMQGEIKVWDLEAGKEILSLRGHTDAVRCLALSPDGKRLFSGSGDFLSGEIKVWNLEVGKEILTLRGHKAIVHSLVLSPDGKRLFSGSSDGTIKVWDFDAGE